MTEYTDVPTASVLHAESQQIIDALANLDAGGTISSMVFSPPLPVPPTPGEPATPPLFTVSVFVPPPIDPVVLSQIRAWLEQRLVTISAELTALGVSVPAIPSMASMARTMSRMPGIPLLPQYPPMSVMPPPGPPPTVPPPPATPRAPDQPV